MERRCLSSINYLFLILFLVHWLIIDDTNVNSRFCIPYVDLEIVAVIHGKVF